MARGPDKSGPLACQEEQYLSAAAACKRKFMEIYGLFTLKCRGNFIDDSFPLLVMLSFPAATLFSCR
jgi:hypothetical protein